MADLIAKNCPVCFVDYAIPQSMASKMKRDGGIVGWFDHPEYHGDDCAEGLEDHLIECPECITRRARESRATPGASCDPQESVGDAPQEVRPEGPQGEL